MRKMGKLIKHIIKIDTKIMNELKETIKNEIEELILNVDYLLVKKEGNKEIIKNYNVKGYEKMLEDISSEDNYYKDFFNEFTLNDYKELFLKKIKNDKSFIEYKKNNFKLFINIKNQSNTKELAEKIFEKI
jgi:hypothetical protein